MWFLNNLTKYSILVGLFSFSTVKAASYKIDFYSAASPAAWQSFMQAQPQTLERLWSGNKGLEGFRRAHWSWRLAWLERCSTSHMELCQSILARALADRALLVRAKAVQIIGQRYEGRDEPSILQALNRAFHDQRNYRRGKPLEIQKHILYALKTINTPEADALSQQLGQTHPLLSSYLNKL